MVQKKSKGSKNKGSSGGGKPKEPKNTRKPPPPSTQLPPQDRVANIRPYWETLDNDARLKLLSVGLEVLREQSKEPRDTERVDIHGNGYLALPGDVSLPEVLDEGIFRLKEKSTWKVWQWMPDSVEFFDADSFRNYLQDKVIPDDLRRLLPRDDGRPVEKPAEAALRQRMTDLLTRIQNHGRQYQEEPCSRPYRSRLGGRGLVDSGSIIIRDTNVEIITMILEALEREHEFVYQTMLLPITQFVCEVVPDDMRESTKTELYFEDLERMPPDDVVRIVEWLTEKVDAWGSKLKPEAKDQEEDDEEESMGDVDLFSLTDDAEGLTVNSKWLQHLGERLLGEDGHPRKVQAKEDPHKMGLVLEWVYGSIVSTAEKARDSAKRALGCRKPTAEQAYTQLLDALRDQSTWEERARTAKELMAEMLRTRKEAAEYQKQFGLKPPAASTTTALANGLGASGTAAAAAAALRSQHLQALTSMLEEPTPLPDEVIVAMLRREVLLTRAKLHSLLFEHIMSEKQLRSLKAQLRQGEPEFDRLKRELEEVKHAPRGLDGTYRSAAEMERHRHQLADAAIEEQLEVQTAFREQGARLQQIYDRRQRTEQEIAKREQEISHLNGWRATVEKLLHQFEELTSDKPLDSLEDGLASATEATSNGNELTTTRSANPNVTLYKLRNHFMKDVRKQLYNDEDDKMFFGWIQQELKQVEKRLEDGRAALQHLEMQLINVACDDPGALIGAQLVLPTLQERLDERALKFHEEKAKEAEVALISMEAEKAAKDAAEKEKKAKQKQSKKGKSKTEAERKAAEKAAKEAAEAEKKAEDEKRRQLEEEEHRRQLRERLEVMRKQEEEIMERRRQELLNDADGYWRQRMEEERAAQALLIDDRCAASVEDQASIRDTESSIDGANLSSDEGFTPSIRQARKQEKGDKPQSPLANGERSVLKAMPNGFSQENGRSHEHPSLPPQQLRRRQGAAQHSSNAKGAPNNRPSSLDFDRQSRFQPPKSAQRDTELVLDNAPRKPRAETQHSDKGSSQTIPNGTHHPPPNASQLGNRMKGEVYPGLNNRQVVLIHAPEGTSRRRSDGVAEPSTPIAEQGVPAGTPSSQQTQQSSTPALQNTPTAAPTAPTPVDATTLQSGPAGDAAARQAAPPPPPRPQQQSPQQPQPSGTSQQQQPIAPQQQSPPQPSHQPSELNSTSTSAPTPALNGVAPSGMANAASAAVRHELPAHSSTPAAPPSATAAQAACTPPREQQPPNAFSAKPGSQALAALPHPSQSTHAGSTAGPPAGSHDPAAHGPAPAARAPTVHGPAAHSPASHGPAAHAPTSHGPASAVHGPAVLGPAPAAHGSSAHGSVPAIHAPTAHGPAPTAHVPSAPGPASLKGGPRADAAPTAHQPPPTPHAAHPHIPQSQAPHSQAPHVAAQHLPSSHAATRHTAAQHPQIPRTSVEHLQGPLTSMPHPPGSHPTAQVLQASHTGADHLHGLHMPAQHPQGSHPVPKLLQSCNTVADHLQGPHASGQYSQGPSQQSAAHPRAGPAGPYGRAHGGKYHGQGTGQGHGPVTANMPATPAAPLSQPTPPPPPSTTSPVAGAPYSPHTAQAPYSVQVSHPALPAPASHSAQAAHPHAVRNHIQPPPPPPPVQAQTPAGAMHQPIPPHPSQQPASSTHMPAAHHHSQVHHPPATASAGPASRPIEQPPYSLHRTQPHPPPANQRQPFTPQHSSHVPKHNAAPFIPHHASNLVPHHPHTAHETALHPRGPPQHGSTNQLPSKASHTQAPPPPAPPSPSPHTQHSPLLAPHPAPPSPRGPTPTSNMSHTAPHHIPPHASHLRNVPPSTRAPYVSYPSSVPANPQHTVTVSTFNPNSPVYTPTSYTTPKPTTMAASGTPATTAAGGSYPMGILAGSPLPGMMVPPQFGQIPPPPPTQPPSQQAASTMSTKQMSQPAPQATTHAPHAGQSVHAPQTAQAVHGSQAAQTPHVPQSVQPASHSALTSHAGQSAPPSQLLQPTHLPASQAPPATKSSLSLSSKTSTLRAAAPAFIPRTMQNLVVAQLPVAGASIKKSAEPAFSTTRSIPTPQPRQPQSTHVAETSKPQGVSSQPPPPPPQQSSTQAQMSSAQGVSMQAGTMPATPALSAQAGTMLAVAAQGMTIPAVSAQARSTLVVTTQAVPAQGVTMQAVSAQDVTTQAESAQGENTPDVIAQGVATPVVSAQGETTQVVSGQAVSAPDATEQAASAQDGTEQAVSPQGVTASVVSALAVTAQDVTTQAVSQVVTTQAVSAQGVTAQAGSAQGVTMQAVSAQAVATHALSAQGATTHAVSTQGVTTQAVSAQGVTSQAVSVQEVVTTQVVSAPAVPAQGVTMQALSAQGVTMQAVSAQGVATQAVSAEGVATQAVSAQGVTPQAESVQAVSPQAELAQAVTPQALSGQVVPAEGVSGQNASASQPPSSQPVAAIAASARPVAQQQPQQPAAVKAGSPPWTQHWIEAEDPSLPMPPTHTRLQRPAARAATAGQRSGPESWSSSRTMPQGSAPAQKSSETDRQPAPAAKVLLQMSTSKDAPAQSSKQTKDAWSANMGSSAGQQQPPVTERTSSSRTPTQSPPVQPLGAAAAAPTPSTQRAQSAASHAVTSPLLAPAGPSPTPTAPMPAGPPMHSTPSWSSIAAKDAAGGTSVSPVAPTVVPQASTQPHGSAPVASGPVPTASAAVWRAPSDTWKTKLTKASAAEYTPRSRDATDSGPAHSHRSVGHAGATMHGSSQGSSQPVEASGRHGSNYQPMPSRSGKPIPRQSSLARSTHPNDDSFLAAPPMTAGMAKVQHVGGVSFEGFAQNVRVFRLVRGLVNDDGSYNCFLNVIIQSLWHLRGFRECLLQSSPLPGATPAADVKVYTALWSIFQKLALPPAKEVPAQDSVTHQSSSPKAGPPSVRPAKMPSSPRIKIQQGWVVDPVELREALSGLQQGQNTSILIQLSEMHDASEVLGEVLNCLHRAEAGASTDGANDVQLPKRVQVKKSSGRPAHSNGFANGNGLAHHANGNGLASRGGPVAAQNGMQGPGLNIKSLVHKVFGLDVQVPAPPSSDDDEDDSKERKRKQKNADWSSSDNKPVKPKEPRDPSMMEVHQYMKYFHLVPAQGLRQACDILFDGSFEDIVREADAADTLLQRLKSGAGSVPHMSLLRRPPVFTLAIVWESPQAPLDAVKGTIRALAAEVDLSKVVSGLPAGQPHRLRSVVCYFGHHYQAFVLSEECNEWLLFDDTTIRLIGSWRAVQAAMVQQRLQPSLLFYEDCSRR